MAYDCIGVPTNRLVEKVGVALAEAPNRLVNVQENRSKCLTWINAVLARWNYKSTADMKSGVLTVALPMNAGTQKKSRKVEIKAA
jgi:hypothetical protein